MNKSLEYLDNLRRVLDEIAETQPGAIDACAAAFARTLEGGHEIFLFGTGHSHMLAEELFYRAGKMTHSVWLALIILVRHQIIRSVMK